MKTLNYFIQEKLKVNSKSKISSEVLRPEEIKGPETPGKDSNDEDITIIGKPFKTVKDTNYKESIELIKDRGDIILKDIYELDEDELKEFDWFVYFKRKKSGHTVFCCGYGYGGAYGII